MLKLIQNLLKWINNLELFSLSPVEEFQKSVNADSVSVTRLFCIYSSKIHLKTTILQLCQEIIENLAKISSFSPLQFLQCSAVISK
jgi:hypothetical protein